MTEITLDLHNVASIVARWRTLTAAVNADLAAVIGQNGDEVVMQILDEAREETLKALVNRPVTSHEDAHGLVSVADYLMRADNREDGLEACLLRKAADFLETATNVGYDAPATKLTA
jgi:uncharacterized protein YrzB (UPF0473 family)